jgi:hypothetical protein
LLKYAFRGFDVITPGNLPSDCLTGWEANDSGQVYQCVWFFPIRTQAGAQYAWLDDISFGEVEIGMSQICQQRFTTKDQVIDHGDFYTQAEQFSGEQRANITRSTRNHHMAEAIFCAIRVVIAHTDGSIYSITFTP